MLAEMVVFFHFIPTVTVKLIFLLGYHVLNASMVWWNFLWSGGIYKTRLTYIL